MCGREQREKNVYLINNAETIRYLFMEKISYTHLTIHKNNNSKSMKENKNHKKRLFGKCQISR